MNNDNRDHTFSRKKSDFLVYLIQPAVLPRAIADPPVKKLIWLLSLLCCLPMNSSSNEELIIAGDHPGPISDKQIRNFYQ